ncbi:serine hydrolase domain-containing protein [Streptosporangium sp. NBC_01469]|uniref:serine hydrolase domain-containing protein n=1 Tax=Streptosporangium sp. NBC_01469 TaxID=2903898 RepID=UPI002E2E59B9|nr:serine hydrolase domain-containing protein [Streptosporangium sp. NBC_01469]
MPHSTVASPSTRPASAGRRGLLALATAAAVALGTLGLATAPATADAAPRTGPADHVQTSLNDLVRDGGFPAALAAVRGRDGRTRDYTAGVADLKTRAKVPVNGRVRIGSNTKTFVAVVVLQLAGEGKLDLDAPVEEYLPGLIRGNGNDGRNITIRQLLQHTSGLPDYARDLPPFSEFQHRYFEPRELLDRGLAQKPVAAPGEGWSYSNTGYVVLGLLVQKVTGRPIGEEVTGRIIKPLGLRDTYWPGVGEQEIRGAHPHGYAPTGPASMVDVTRMDPSTAWAAGQLIATPRDVNSFLVALLGGKLLKPAQLEEMRRTVEMPAPPAGWGYGLGLMKIRLSCGGYAWGHGGDVPGYETRNGVTEDGRSAMVAVTALPGTPAVGQQVNAALDTALCAGR